MDLDSFSSTLHRHRDAPDASFGQDDGCPEGEEPCGVSTRVVGRIFYDAFFQRETVWRDPVFVFWKLLVSFFLFSRPWNNGVH